MKISKIICAIIAFVIRFVANHIVGNIYTLIGRDDTVETELLHVADLVENEMDEDKEIVSQNIKAAFKNIKADNQYYKNEAKNARYYASNNYGYDDTLVDGIKRWVRSIAEEICFWAIFFIAILIAVLATGLILLIISLF